MVTILDCTLRDGGYYTGWDFDRNLVDSYLKTLSRFPIDYLEIGYRSPVQKEYLGEYFYSPLETIQRARSLTHKSTKLALMLNTKDCNTKDLKGLLGNCRGLIDLVRLATDPASVERAAELAAEIKALGFSTGLNLMYLSKNRRNDSLLQRVKLHEECFDFVYLVDSYGSCFPEDVQDEVRQYKQVLKSKIGFHGHNNIELAFPNALAAIQAGADIVDSTVLGMGRGAGNLATELLLAYISYKGEQNLDLSDLSQVVGGFNELKKQYAWGTGLPYMISGFADLPQKDVMDWLSKRRYKISTIVKVLQGAEPPSLELNSSIRSVAELKNQKFSGNPVDRCIIVGGGPSAITHFSAVSSYAMAQEIPLVHSSLRHASEFTEHPGLQLVCLSGVEVLRVGEVKALNQSKNLGFLVAEPPRLYSTVSENISGRVFEVPVFESQEQKNHSILDRETPLGLAFGCALALGCKEIALVGFDGYRDNQPESREFAREVQILLDAFRLAYPEIKVFTLTPSKYSVSNRSLYALLSQVT